MAHYNNNINVDKAPHLYLHFKTHHNLLYLTKYNPNKALLIIKVKTRTNTNTLYKSKLEKVRMLILDA